MILKIQALKIIFFQNLTFCFSNMSLISNFNQIKFQSLIKLNFKFSIFIADNK